MGQPSSVPIGSRGGRRKSFRGVLKSPFLKRHQSHMSPLSAACNFIEVDQKVDQLNVNTATEEELMTLPGINRNIAQKIVEYRQAIGRFKKVEDVALVSGIGAERFDLIRPEICVNRRKNASCASSRAQSFDSLPSTESTRLGLRSSPQARAVNINTASVFDLMAIQGLNQELAANVVHYRERRGHFQTVDDLIKVKGINQWRLGALHGQVFVDAPEESLPKANGMTTGITLPNINPIKLQNGKISGHRKTMSAPIKYVPMSNGLLPNKDIFELLSAYSQRPIVEEDFQNERNGKPALRIATWNLNDFSADKTCNPGVRETICRTILENRFAVIAVQEIVDSVSLKQLCDELNNPVLRRVADWKDNHRQWKMSSINHGLAFIYDSSCGAELSAIDEVTVEAAEPLTAVLATFQLKGLTVSLLNVYLLKNIQCYISSIETSVEGLLEEPGVLVILGDFTGCTIHHSNDGDVENLHYKSILPPTTSTNSYNGHQEPRYCDNIYLNEVARLQYTDVWGVVRHGLTHLAIPRGWMWGGPASEHCPVWCEVYTTILQKHAEQSC